MEIEGENPRLSDIIKIGRNVAEESAKQIENFSFD